MNKRNNTASVQPEQEQPAVQDKQETIIVSNKGASETHATEESEKPQFHINGGEYLRLKAAHPTHMIGVQDGAYVLFCGEEAKQLAAEYPRKIYEQDITSLGVVPVTGFAESWQAVGNRLQLRGHSVTLAREEAGAYEVIQSMDSSEFIPLGMKLEDDGRIFTVESVDYRAGMVELRDDTFAGSRGFPIFRKEPVRTVREWVEQQWKADQAAVAEGRKPQNPDHDPEDMLMMQAKSLILSFWDKEYGTANEYFPTEINLHHVGLGYTTAGNEDEHDLQVEVDLIDYALNYYADGKLVLQEKYGSLQDLVHTALENLDFNELYAAAMEAANFSEHTANYHQSDSDINVADQKRKYPEMEM